MSSVVFLRAANVGGHNRFRPSALAGELRALEMINVGAAGTFVLRGRRGSREIRDAFLEALPFEPLILVCRGSEIAELAASEPFRSSRDLKGFVSVLERAPARLPDLPLCRPDGERWETRTFAVSGRFALSHWRRLGKNLVDLNGVVEKGFGLRATTRNWNTIVKIADILAKI